MTEQEYRKQAHAILNALTVPELREINDALTIIEELPLKFRIVFGRIFTLRLQCDDVVSSSIPEHTPESKDS